MNTEAEKNDTDRMLDGVSIDWFLQQLIDYANENEGFEIPLTLNVQGSTVSGILISGKKYFVKFAEQFVDGWSEGEAKKSWYDVFSGYANSIYQDDSDKLPPNFIHMADARIHHPNGNLPNNTGVLWRGKLNAVSGFWLGQLVPSTDEA